MKKLYADEKIGIGTKTPSVLLDISGTGAIRLPVGNSDDRPAIVDKGMLRYNTQTKQFEGYGEGSWGGLGGVMSLDMNTKITAHDENGLKFFTDGKERMTITEGNHAIIDISDARVNIINSTLDCSGITTNTLNATSLINSKDITIVSKLNGNDASFNNIVKVSDLRVYKDASFYCDISGSDASFNIVDAGKLTVADDLSSNNLIISNTSTLNNVNCRVMEVIGDLSCNDASFNNVAEISHLKVNNASYFFGDISGVDASFNNVDMNGKVSISGHLGGNDASFNNVDMNKLTITGDLSGNNALLHDVSVNRLWIGDVEMIGYIPGAVNDPTNTGTLTGNMIFNGDISANGFFELNGDLSGNDASFNVVDMKQLNVNETIKAATLMYGTTNVKTEMDTKATITYVNNQITGLIDGAPGALDTLNELAAALSDNANYATTITNSLALKAPLANPTFTGTVNGISSTMVGLGNVTNESKTTMFANPTFTGKVGIITNDPSYNLHINGECGDPYLKNPSNVSPKWYGSLHCGTDISGITMGRCTRNGQNTSSAHYNGIQSHSLGVGTSLTINPFGGNVGIGTTNPGYKLEVNGSLYYASGGLNGSDDRIKHNEQSITNALSIISKLKPKHYIKTGTKLYEASHNFQLDASGNPLDSSGNPLEHIEDYTIETGIIAQEIKNIPELKFVVYGEEYKEKVINVYKKDASGNNILDASGNSIIENTITEMEPNTLCVDYNSIHCTHIAATQELDKIQQEEKTKLLEAEAKIAASEAKIAASEAKIAALENTLADVLARLAALE